MTPEYSAQNLDPEVVCRSTGLHFTSTAALPPGPKRQCNNIQNPISVSFASLYHMPSLEKTKKTGSVAHEATMQKYPKEKYNNLARVLPESAQTHTTSRALAHFVFS
jgi:hypothetical protein